MTVVIGSISKASEKASNEHLNEQIKKLCQDTLKYNFVDNDGSFKLADMTINEAFFVDGSPYIIPWYKEISQ